MGYQDIEIHADPKNKNYSPYHVIIKHPHSKEFLEKIKDLIAHEAGAQIHKVSHKTHNIHYKHGKGIMDYVKKPAEWIDKALEFLKNPSAVKQGKGVFHGTGCGVFHGTGKKMEILYEPKSKKNKNIHAVEIEGGAIGAIIASLLGSLAPMIISKITGNGVSHKSHTFNIKHNGHCSSSCPSNFKKVISSHLKEGKGVFHGTGVLEGNGVFHGTGKKKVGQC
jgi:hypothetical protein